MQIAASHSTNSQGIYKRMKEGENGGGGGITYECEAELKSVSKGLTSTGGEKGEEESRRRQGDTITDMTCTLRV